MKSRDQNQQSALQICSATIYSCNTGMSDNYTSKARGAQARRLRLYIYVRQTTSVHITNLQLICSTCL